jgi:NAD(P)-dependent dehydrogenase (short-subunit alcohol dehydrogenase family)
MEKAMQLGGGHIVVIGRSGGIGLAAARLAGDEGAEVTITSCSQEKLTQTCGELGQVPKVVMAIADEGAAEKGFAGLSPIDHRLI